MIQAHIMGPSQTFLSLKQELYPQSCSRYYTP